MNEIARRFVVKPAADGRWTFGRTDAVFQIFDSKDAAVSAAERFLAAHPDLELVMQDDSAASDQPARPRSTRARRDPTEQPSLRSAGTHDVRKGEPPTSAREQSAAGGGKEVVWGGSS